MKTVDARGLSCPEPVMQFKNALRRLAPGEGLEILVETVTSRENIKRAAEKEGFAVQIEPIEDGFKLTVTPS